MAAARGSGSRSYSSRSGSSRPGPYRSRPRRGSEPARHRGLGFLFWLCLVGVVVAVAVAAREPLKAAVAQLRGAPGPAAAAPAGPAAPTGPAAAAGEQPRVTVTPLTDRERTAGLRNPPAGSAPSAERPSAALPAAGSPGSAGSTASSPPAAMSPAGAARSAAAVPDHPSIRKARLYFATVDSAGRIALKSVIRSIPASDSPLTDTLDSLLKGPTSQELNLGLVSMIPTGVSLRSAVVKDDTAILDFSESFRFNSQGLDAMDAQLRQVVYAATEFPSVRKVQIRIEGATVRSLGAEVGMRLDAPLTRDSFR